MWPRSRASLGPGPSTRVRAAVVLAAPVGGGNVNSLTYVTKAAAPTWLVHGTADTKVSTWESQKLVSALKVAGATATLDLQIGAGHDIGSLLSPATMQSIITFLNQELRGVRLGRSGARGYMAAPLTEWVDPVPLDLGGTLFKTYPTPVRGPDTFAGYRIYLPPDYATNTTRRYPVIYFLHGSGQDAKRPITSGYIARVDAAIRSGVMPPTIVVAASAPNRNRWMDTFDGKVPIESVLWKNLLPHIDATYRTIATREARAIEGHSMGGFGALFNGFNNPDLFMAVTGNSSGPTLEIAEGPPEPGNIDSFKEIYGSDRNRFIAQAPITLAAKNAAKLRERHIRIICGTEDPAFERVKLFHEALTKLDIPHEFLPVQGSPHNHDQLLEYQTFNTMAFYGKVFGKSRASMTQNRHGRGWRSVTMRAVQDRVRGGVAISVVALQAQTPAPGVRVRRRAPIDRASIVWPPGYIEPNTPGMPYLTPETPTGTGRYKAIMVSDPGAPEFVTYHPANLAALGDQKMPILVWGNGSCSYIGNRFRYFLTEIASHGYLAMAGGPMGPKERETITMASNNPTAAVGAPPPGAAPAAPAPPPATQAATPAQPAVTVELLSKGIAWAIAENSRPGSKFFGRLDTNAVAVMGQSCGARLAGGFRQ